MNLKTFKLENGDKYFITNEAELDGKKYYLVVKIDDDTDFEVIEKQGDEVVFVEDFELKTILISIMGKSLSE